MEEATRRVEEEIKRQADLAKEREERVQQEQAEKELALKEVCSWSVHLLCSLTHSIFSFVPLFFFRNTG